MARGHSLVEVLFSATLLAFVIMGILQLLPASSLALETSRQQAHAEDIAATVLEERRGQPFGTLTVGAPLALPAVTVDGTTYDSTVEIHSVVDEDVRFVKGIRVVVTWVRRDVTHTFTRDAWIANVAR